MDNIKKLIKLLKEKEWSIQKIEKIKNKIKKIENKENKLKNKKSNLIKKLSNYKYILSITKKFLENKENYKKESIKIFNKIKDNKKKRNY